MNQILDLVKNKLLVETFFIPSLNTEMKGKTLSINQYNRLLDISMDNNSLGLINFLQETDDIIKQNLESTENLSYFDKIFLLMQMKIAQKAEYFGVTGEKYRENLRIKCEGLDLTRFNKEYTYNGVKIVLGINSFDKSVELNNKIFDGEEIEPQSILLSEILRSIIKIEYDETNIEMQDLSPIDLIDTLPATFIESHKECMREINIFVAETNTFTFEETEFSFYPTIDVMLL